MDVKTLDKIAPDANESPESAIKFLLDCLYVYQQGDEDALGYIGYVLSKSFCEEDRTAASGYKLMKRYKSLVSRILDDPNCIIAAMGASWEEDYKDVDPDDYELTITKQDKSKKEVKTFIKSGGRDLPFPITCRMNSSGQWKVTSGFSTILMDVRKPKSEVEDF
ncbi:hypothetical protein GF325_06630 [Candidatus Bathyarchaeota archaeon]|nr:hypothetical protein [Candidatus Bathyarchaeota archaeon]